MGQLSIKLQKGYGDFRLDVDLDFEPSFTAVFGHSGAGKTTMLNLISGLEKLDAGHVIWEENSLADSDLNVHVPPHRREIGYIVQDAMLFPHKTVRSNLNYGLANTPGEKRRFAMDDVLDVLGLKSFLDRMPDTLSGGERQRVALGRALLASPSLLLMDEPLAALDRMTKLRFLSYLGEVHAVFDLPILYVSHDITTIINFAKDAIVLDAGSVRAYDEARKALLDNAASAGSGEVENIFKAHISARHLGRGIAELDVGQFTLTIPDPGYAEGDAVMVEIPSSEVILATIRPEGISARNILNGSVRKIHMSGVRCLIDIDVGRQITAEILQYTKTELGLAVGMEVYVIIKAKCVHLIGGGEFQHLSRR